MYNLLTFNLSRALPKSRWLKLCIEKALAFLPKLKEGLAKHARSQKDDSSDDFDDLFK